jgi:hypothetical protein
MRRASASMVEQESLLPLSAIVTGLGLLTGRGNVEKRYLSRSSYEAFSKCQRLGYYRFMKDGTGYEGPKSPALVVGLGTHKGIEVALRGGTPEEVEAATVEEIRGALGLPQDQPTPSNDRDAQNEALAVGLALAWQRVRLPFWQENFDFLSIEQEISVPLSHDLVLQARADLVVRERSSGLLFVVNWKTTSSLKDWTLKWLYDIQAMTEALAVQESLGENVVGCLFEGLYKGSVLKGGISGSPLVTALSDGVVYYPQGSGKRESDQLQRIFPYKDFPGGTRAWVEFLDVGELQELFSLAEPILKNDDRVRAWLRQVTTRESTNRQMLLEEVPEEDRETYFWQNPSQECRWCDFKGACWEGLTIDQLGLLPRKDHHGRPSTESPL